MFCKVYTFYFHHQSSIINHQSSIINHQSSIIKIIDDQNHQSSKSKIINHQNHQSSKWFWWLMILIASRVLVQQEFITPNSWRYRFSDNCVINCWICVICWITGSNMLISPYPQLADLARIRNWNHPCDFEDRYLRAQMELEGVLWCKLT